PKSNRTVTYFKHGLWWIAALLIAIHVARDSGHWREPLQLREHGPVADIACVQDVINALKMPQDRPIKQPVRIRDDTYPKGLSRHGFSRVNRVDSVACVIASMACRVVASVAKAHLTLYATDAMDATDAIVPPGLHPSQT